MYKNHFKTNGFHFPKIGRIPRPGAGAFFLALALLFTQNLTAQEEPANAVEAEEETPRRSLNYFWGAALDLAFRQAGEDSPDAEPALGTPRWELQTQLNQLTERPWGDDGLFFQSEVDIGGRWAELELGRYSWSVDEVSHDTRLGWLWQTGRQGGRWTLETALVLRGAFNDSKKDIILDASGDSLQRFSQQSMGLGLTWNQRLGDSLRLDYKPQFDLMYLMDEGRFWFNAQLDLELSLRGEDSRWQVGLSPGFTNEWLPQPSFGTHLRWYGELGFLQVRAELMKYDWSIYYLDGNTNNGINQSALWSSGLRLQWSADDWTFGLSLDQPWWSLDRNRENSALDKPFTLGLFWELSGRERQN